MKQFIQLLVFLITITIYSQDIGFLGDFNGWGNDIDMSTADNVTYTKNNYFLPGGEIKFREGNNWNGNQWPGSNYSVTSSGFYDISLDTSNGNISLVPSASSSNQNISLIGDFNGWTDTVMTTTDNITYTLVGVTITTGSLKFRRDSGWECNWGDNTTADGTADPNSDNNIVITSDNSYDVSFNLQTLEYLIEVSATASNDSKSELLNDYTLYPNPTTDFISIKSKNIIEHITIFDVNGKEVFKKELNSKNFDLRLSLSTGVYMVRFDTDFNSGYKRLLIK